MTPLQLKPSSRQRKCFHGDGNLTSAKQAGLSLLELMISLSLGLLLLTGIGTIFVGSNQTYRVQEQNARIQESGRYALDAIGRHIRQAGYWLLPIEPTSLKSAFTGTVITGVNGASGASDTVTVQYEGVVDDADCEGNVVTSAMTAAATPPGSVVIQNAIRLNGTDLQCDGSLDGTVDHQPLVSNVENLQVIYGIDTDADLFQSANRFVDTPANWNQVVSVRVCLLIRSEEQGITTSAQTYLNCNGALGADTNAANDFTTATDSRLRRAFVATFNLRNRIHAQP